MSLTGKEDSTLWQCLFPNSPNVNAILVIDSYQYRTIQHAHLICSNIIPPHSQKWKYCCKVSVTESPDDIQGNVMTVVYVLSERNLQNSVCAWQRYWNVYIMRRRWVLWRQTSLLNFKDNICLYKIRPCSCQTSYTRQKKTHHSPVKFGLSVPMRMSLLHIQNGRGPIQPWKPCQKSQHSSEDRNQAPPE
jgi:hypothetical protein